MCAVHASQNRHKPIIEIWRDPNIKTRDIAQIEDRFYFIRQITPTKDEDGILVTRLSLEEDDSGTWSAKL